VFENVSAQWSQDNSLEQLDTDNTVDEESSSRDLHIKGVSFKLKKGNKVAVIGEVASGKTSLLMTILNEIVVLSGVV